MISYESGEHSLTALWTKDGFYPLLPQTFLSPLIFNLIYLTASPSFEKMTTKMGSAAQHSTS